MLHQEITNFASVHVTTKDGSDATIQGDIAAVYAVEHALKHAGFEWNSGAGCWEQDPFSRCMDNELDK